MNVFRFIIEVRLCMSHNRLQPGRNGPTVSKSRTCQENIYGNFVNEILQRLNLIVEVWRYLVLEQHFTVVSKDQLRIGQLLQGVYHLV